MKTMKQLIRNFFSCFFNDIHCRNARFNIEHFPQKTSLTIRQKLELLSEPYAMKIKTIMPTDP